MKRDGRKARGRHGEALMRLIHQVTASNSERATLDLNVRQRLVLQCLGLEGEQPIAAIGQRLGLSPSTMTGLVDRLEEQGYVKRRSHSSDRRVTVLALARKGDVAFARELHFYRALVDRILDTLGEDAKAVVLHALAALHPSGAQARVNAA